MIINKNFLRKNHIRDLEKIKSNLIKINYQITTKDNNVFDDLEDELYQLSFQLYLNKTEYYILEIEEEIKNQLPRIIDVVDDINILKKLSKNK